MSYGDRKHWDFTVFSRLNISRWCSLGVGQCGVKVYHPVTFKLWNRAGSAAQR